MSWRMRLRPLARTRRPTDDQRLATPPYTTSTLAAAIATDAVRRQHNLFTTTTLRMPRFSRSGKDFLGNSGSTSSSTTGPDGAVEGSYYIYTESSSPNAGGDQFILTARYGDKDVHSISF